ncbi:MAG: phage tail protein [Stenotrophomonas sp.]|jgi:phage protein U|uniref:phage tail protein n=1 Tax=Stenotrophomonas sp. TaxID=69392 RepID=UPI00284C9CBB|nr:phage tail protein [Stenotrophomonas sp.]MDR2958629.1 phage tail protein [Stenotrophomonas sp.]
MSYLELFNNGLGMIAGAATAARRDLEQVTAPVDKAMLHIRSGVAALDGLPGVTPEAAAKLKRVTDGIVRAQGKLQDVVKKAQAEQEKLQENLDKTRKVAAEVNERVKLLGEEINNAGQAVNKVLGKIDPCLKDILPSSVLAPKLDPSEQMCKVPQHLLIMTPLKSTEQTYYFNVDTTGFQRLTRSSSYAWKDQARLGRRSAQQSVGLGPETLTLNGVVMPLFIRAGDTSQRVGWNQPRMLRDIAQLREPVHLGTGRGDDLGNWCLSKITETQEALFANGVPRQQTLDLEFIRYGDDDSQKL